MRQDNDYFTNGNLDGGKWYEESGFPARPAERLSDGSFAQEDIDQILRFGSNTENSRMRVSLEFMKEKSPEEIAEFLKKEYHGGYGLGGTTGDLSAWYAEDGIHLCEGYAAQYDPNAQIISWKDAAVHIGELLNSGNFATPAELINAPKEARVQAAQSLCRMLIDMSDAAKEQNFMPSLRALRDLDLDFFEKALRLTGSLGDPVFVDKLISELEAFSAASAQDRGLLTGFTQDKPSVVLEQLRELPLIKHSMERSYSNAVHVHLETSFKGYTSEHGMLRLNEPKSFITRDEINQVLIDFRSIKGDKGRIYDFFTENHTQEEKITFLKNEYGVGDYGSAISGAVGSLQHHDGNGILLHKSGCPDVKLPWSDVSERISALIREKKYLTPEEQARMKEGVAKKPSILKQLKRPLPPSTPKKKKTQDRDAR